MRFSLCFSCDHLRCGAVVSAAAASEADVFALWSGLGYYRRASNLLKGAKYVAEKHSGELPLDVKQLKEVPGIGDYTAGAISSIAGGLVAPLVDGNVVRVFSRVRRIGLPAKAPALNKACWRIATDVVCPTSPADFNSGLMELGATICTPRSPACGACPMRAAGLCQAFDEAAQLLRAKGLPALQIAIDRAGADDGGAEAGVDDDEIVAIDGEASGGAGAGVVSPKTVVGAGKAAGSKAGAASVSASKAKPSKSAQPSLLGFFSSTKKDKAEPATVASASSTEGAEASDSARAAGGEGAGAAASTSSASEAALPHSGFSPEELAAIGKYVEGRWPAPAAKKAVPTLELTVVVPVRKVVAAASAAVTSAAGPAAATEELLVWLSNGMPASSVATVAITKPASAAAASHAEAIEIVSDDDDGAAAAKVSTAASAASAGTRITAKPAAKRPKAAAAAAAGLSSADGAASPAHVLAGALLKGQWQPLLLRTEALLDSALVKPTAAAPADKGGKAVKRPRKAAGKGAAADEGDGSGADTDDDGDGDVVAAVAPRLDAASPRVVSTVASALEAAGLTPARTSAAAAAPASAALPAGVSLQHCGTVTHVFSHVIHRLQVLRVDLDLNLNLIEHSGGADGGAASMPSSPADSSAKLSSTDGARWVAVSELPAVGVTTWAAKILYAALLGTAGSGTGGGAAKGLTSSSSGAAASANASKSVIGADAPMGEGLQLLVKRWKIAHGKIE